MNLLASYNEALRNIPPPGCGCHAYLLAVANYGVISGMNPQQIHDDLRRTIPQGTRRIPDKEIQDAINKATGDHNGGTYTPRPRPKPVINDGKAARQRIIDQAKITTDVDLWEASPIRLWEAP